MAYIQDSRLVVQEFLYLGTLLVLFLDERVYNREFALKALCSYYIWV
jgi:hypothetical protein